MESSSDKHWVSHFDPSHSIAQTVALRPIHLTFSLGLQAHKALIDPLMEPEPAQEDGPGTSFRGQPATASSPPPPPVRTPISPASSTGSVLRKKNNPYRKSSSASKNPFVSANEISPKNAYPSPPQSSSPHRDQFPHRKEAFAEYRDVPSPPPNGDSDSTPSRRRGSSLTERFPGDRSHKPLEAMKKDAKAANRAPHLRKHHQIRPDSIDQLDLTGAGYHHEGPFDATYLARNTSYTNSPLEALAQSNEEAIKATPRERIIDSIERHRPLDGVATYPPGEEDPSGHVYNYEPGENLMIEGNPEGGAYKRWPGIVSLLLFHCWLTHLSVPLQLDTFSTDNCIYSNTFPKILKEKASHHTQSKRL